MSQDKELTASTDSSIELLRTLCDVVGVSGYEDEVRSVVISQIEGLVDEWSVDPLGNLIAWKRCSNPDAPTLMLDAHMDEIGLVISHIEPGGFLRFATIGGWDERVLPAHAVTIVTREGRKIRGVLGVPPPHIQREEDRRKPYTTDALFIDVGARSREHAEEMGIRVGDSAALFYPFTELTAGAVMGKALDNRAGCAALISVLRELNELKTPLNVNIAAVFTTFEEIGARGAKVAAYSVDPQIALIFEGTVAGDFPGVAPARCPSTQGKGPAITIMDRTTHCSPRVIRLLEEIGERNGIPHQLKTPLSGGTDGARIHITRGGVLTGVVSVPCRYIHSPNAILRMEDFTATVKLATAFVQECRNRPTNPIVNCLAWG